MQAVIAKMRAMAAKANNDENVNVAVGYTAKYALFVHENIAMKWRGQPRQGGAPGVYWGPAGQAKFLEDPFRQMGPTLLAQVIRDRANGLTMAQALLTAGLALQRASMQLVPVLTGHLRSTAFTRLEKK